MLEGPKPSQPLPTGFFPRKIHRKITGKSAWLLRHTASRWCRSRAPRVGGMYSWEKVSSAPGWAPRDGAGGLVFGGRMWLLGGWNWDDPVNFPRHTNSEVWASADGQEWELVTKAAPWEGRHCAGYVVHGQKLWVVGGDANQGHYQNDVWCSSDGKDWECACADVPWRGRIAHITVAHAGAIYVIGGQNFPGWKGSFGKLPDEPQRYYSDVWRSVDGRSWERILDNAPWAPRGYVGGAGSTMNGRIYLVGGGTYETVSEICRPSPPDPGNDTLQVSQGVLNSAPRILAAIACC